MQGKLCGAFPYCIQYSHQPFYFKAVINEATYNHKAVFKIISYRHVLYILKNFTGFSCDRCCMHGIRVEGRLPNIWVISSLRCCMVVWQGIFAIQFLGHNSLSKLLGHNSWRVRVWDYFYLMWMTPYLMYCGFDNGTIFTVLSFKIWHCIIVLFKGCNCIHAVSKNLEITNLFCACF